MNTVDQTLTISTRVQVECQATNEILSDLCELYSTALYTAVSRRNRGITIVKPDFMREFGLSSRNFNSVIRSADGMIKSVLSNMENYAKEHEAKANSLNKIIIKMQMKRGEVVDKLLKVQEDLRAKPDCPTLLKIQSQLKNKRQKLNNHILQRSRRRDKHYRMQDELLGKIKAEHASICFGSKKLFNAQNHLSQNRLGDFDHWKRIWKKSRYNEFFSIGSKDENMGNQTCVIARDGDEAYQLRIRLPYRIAAKHGISHALLKGLRFSYRPELVENIFVAHAQRKAKETEFANSKTNLTKSQYLSDYGQAVSYRLMKDEKGWILYLSTDQKFHEAEFDSEKGVIGLDFNNGFVSVASINAAGQKVEVFDKRYDTTRNKSSKSNDTAMQLLAIDLVSYAKELGKPIVIESLDFSKKKGGLVNAKGNEQYHNMISQLSYKKFRQALKMQCLSKGVALKEVSPAYTSFVGRVKYARETNFSTHQAAAWCIALVGMGKSVERMRLPQKFVIRQKGFVLDLTMPEDMAKVSDNRKLSVVSKRVSKMVDDMVTARRKEHLATKRAAYTDRLLARLRPHPVLSGGHQQVSNARSADEDVIPY